ncbi:unnamed protein product [Adineta ricciae]|uniref:Uncharacterized protein n=1 Tax=Adineta ricciae TaxID=249248 RepID=A0A815A9R3_ADIRI|nr:unnamed protein product [Adineta ricciae]CAF1254179.1 unnamed protein product [Adineta ricciae]
MAKNINRHSNDIIINRENIRLIYLDKTAPTSDFQSKLSEINPAIQFYTDKQLCQTTLKSIVLEDIFLILANISFVDILDAVHSLQSIVAVFVYDNNRQIDDLKSQYSKIIDLYTNEDELCCSIKEKLQYMERQMFIYHILDPQRPDFTRQSAFFLWHQMLIDVLKQIPQNEFRRDEFLNRCALYYQQNRLESDQIEAFRSNYTSQQPIEWLIKDCCLYKLLNRALNTEDIEFLSSFRLFILDLHTSIEKDYAKIDHQGSIILYRRQMMQRDEIDQLKQNIGCLISISGFLVTLRDKTKALASVQPQITSKEDVFLEIHIDTSKTSATCADVPSNGDEFILNINTSLKIESINHDPVENRWDMKLISSNDGSQYVADYLKLIQNEMNYSNSMIFFGHLLWNDLHRLTQAKTYFQTLLKTLRKDHADIPDIYIELANIYGQMGEHNLALNKSQFALNFRQKHQPNDQMQIAVLLDSIGTIYRHMNNLDRAIDFHGQALYTYETKCSKTKNLLQRANTIANLGFTYKEKNDLDSALNYFNLAYEMRHGDLPAGHPLLAESLYNLANIFYAKNDFNKALNYFQQALAVYPYEHLHQATIDRSIGWIYRDKQDWQTALNYFNRALEIRQHLLPNKNHVDMAVCYGDIGEIYEKMNEFDLALENYQRQFDMEEQCLPLNHPNLMVHFDLIVNLLKKKDQSRKALELCEEKLSTLKLILENDYEDHPRVARILVSIAAIYEDENPKQADQHYQHALSILENRKHEEILQTCLSPMTNFYWKCRMFDRALICQMKLLQLRRSTLSSNHNEIAYTLRGLARLYRAMDKPDDALHYFHQSLNILLANNGREHLDVKTIQQEIFDLKDMVHTTSAGASEEIAEKQPSDTQKRIPPSPKQPLLTVPSIERRTSTKSVTNSAFCVIL